MRYQFIHTCGQPGFEFEGAAEGKLGTGGVRVEAAYKPDGVRVDHLAQLHCAHCATPVTRFTRGMIIDPTRCKSV